MSWLETSWLEIEHARFLGDHAEPARPASASEPATETETAAVETEQPS